MPEPSTPRRWYRSLYARIVLGFVAAAAAVIAVQVIVVLWLIARSGSATGVPPPAFARLVAQDIGRALADDPMLDIDRFVGAEYEQRLYPFIVVLENGRVAASSGTSATPELVALGRAFLTRRTERGAPLEGAPGRGGRGLGGLGGRGGRPDRPPPPAGIRVNGNLVGVVLVAPQPALRRFGPTLVATGLVALAAATALTALIVIGPVRRRLSDLEAAAGAVGQGKLDVRATEDGGDEVSGLARAFNRMAAALRERDHALGEADRTRRLLLADVSHELRTPLTSMRGFIETLMVQNSSADPETRERFLRIVSEETRRLEDLVDDLLDLARIEASGTPLDMQDVSVESLFGSVIERSQLAARTGGVALASRIETGAEIVRGDGRRLSQALLNLVANAVRHTPSGGSVRLECFADAATTVMKVSDTGTGIAPEHLPHVFDRFYKVDGSRTGGAAGSGLGLSIVKAIVDRHGGTVSVASGPAGTTFEVRLPTIGRG